MMKPTSWVSSFAHIFIVVGVITASSIPTTQAATPISEASNGKTVLIKQGSAFEITLHSTYWQFSDLNSIKVVSPLGNPIILAIAPGADSPAGCQHPGMSCGTVTWKLRTKALGIQKITASRTSCGEALRCTGANGLFRVSIKVVR